MRGAIPAVLMIVWLALVEYIAGPGAAVLCGVTGLAALIYALWEIGRTTRERDSGPPRE